MRSMRLVFLPRRLPTESVYLNRAISLPKTCYLIVNTLVEVILYYWNMTAIFSEFNSWYFTRIKELREFSLVARPSYVTISIYSLQRKNQKKMNFNFFKPFILSVTPFMYTYICNIFIYEYRCIEFLVGYLNTINFHIII